ncbi:formylglycine-generating enzyme family protein [Pseudomonas iridis]|uniref:Formylglycine-generating enzyme family protein n=1 Tax=Pseudomonas iridis TaxID=2710587 RepID=A0ABW8DQ49_9PSED
MCFAVLVWDVKVCALTHLIRILLVLRQSLLALPFIMLLGGCEAESGSLPSSKNLSPEKVASIAATVKAKYPDLSSELRDKVLQTVVQSIDNMVFVEGGQFDMGDFGWACEYDEKDVCAWPCGQEPEQLCNISRNGDDDFVHPVTLTSYYFSKYQVSLGDFDVFFTAKGLPLFDAEKRNREDLKFRYQSDLPAPTQSWQQAKDYCEWLGELSAYAVDLPSEAQWEYAARNRGQHILFPTDSGSLDYGKNFPLDDEGNNFPISRFAPSPLGIYGIAGNSTDWVNDWYSKDYYQNSPLKNPKGPSTGLKRIRRGSTVLEAPLSSAPLVRRWAVDPSNDRFSGGTSFRCSIQSDQKL